MSASLRLLSLNIEHSTHLDLVESFLEIEKPEVACIQELYERDAPRIAQTLGGAEYIFAPMTRRPYKGDLAVMGIGIFSKLPIRNMAKPYYRGDGSRIPVFDMTTTITKSETEHHPVLMCDIEKDDAMFRVATTHFTWTPDGNPDDIQRRDIRALLQILSTLSEFVLVGDFNAPRGGEIFGMLAERYKDNVPAHYTTSIDSTLHRRGPLELMVDGVFSTPAYTVSDVEMVGGVSDHCALLATVSSPSA